MSQNSIVIADGSGAAVLTALNNALNTLATGFSGPAEPSPTYAYMIWHDTTNNLRKVRNAANSAWITLGALDAANITIIGTAGGTVDAITCTISTAPASLLNGLKVLARATGANTSTTPTFNLNGLGAKTVVKGSNAALLAGDIPGAGYWMEVVYDSTLDKWVLQNPSNAITLVEHNSNGTHKTSFLTGLFGAWTAISANTVYQAAQDLTVYAGGDSASGGAIDIQILTDAANPPTSLRGRQMLGAAAGVTWSPTAIAQVRKGDYYKVTIAGVVANGRYNTITTGY